MTAELRLGRDLRCSPTRVERLMRQAGVVGIHRRKAKGCTRRDPDAQPSEDLLVQRHSRPSIDPRPTQSLMLCTIRRGESSSRLSAVIARGGSDTSSARSRATKASCSRVGVPIRRFRRNAPRPFSSPLCTR